MPEISKQEEIEIPKQEEIPETVKTEEKSKPTFVFVRPDGTVITREEWEEELQRRRADPNWWCEQP